MSSLGTKMTFQPVYDRKNYLHVISRLVMTRRLYDMLENQLKCLLKA
jgi:hypothetical protein